MNNKTWLANLCAGSMIVLGACAPEPAPQVIYAEPVFNKFGNPSCRPGDVPIGGAYTADLPLCPVIASAPVTAVLVPVEENDDNGTVIVPDVPEDDPTGGNQNQNENQNQNQNNQQAGGN